MFILDLLVFNCVHIHGYHRWLKPLFAPDYPFLFLATRKKALTVERSPLVVVLYIPSHGFAFLDQGSHGELSKMEWWSFTTAWTTQGIVVGTYAVAIKPDIMSLLHREMCGAPINPLEFDLDDGPAIEDLLLSYPSGIVVSDLSHSSEELEDKISIATALYKEGILIIMDDVSTTNKEQDEDDDPF